MMIKKQTKIFGFILVTIFSIILAVKFKTLAINTKYVLAILISYFILTSLFIPKINFPLVRAWMALGELIRKIVSTIVLSTFYFAVISPVGLILRLTGKLNLKQNSFRVTKGHLPNIKYPFE
tara:strand:+ start:80927 stop:81292 length:366 start_codon:yes stop_codon:yes gene_type:complete